MSNYVKRYFSDSDIKKISDAVQKVEEFTNGEIRVVIREHRTWKERHKSLELIARSEFEALGMTATKDRTGVLILVLLRDRQLYIFADEGIYSKIDKTQLNSIAQGIVEKFSKNEYCSGIIEGIEKLGEILRTHCPKTPDNVNELPNDVVIR